MAARDKINAQKSLIFLYRDDEIISFTTASKRIEDLGIDFLKRAIAWDGASLVA